jgi:hypothetical protein
MRIGATAYFVRDIAATWVAGEAIIGPLSKMGTGYTHAGNPFPELGTGAAGGTR